MRRGSVLLLSRPLKTLDEPFNGDSVKVAHFTAANLEYLSAVDAAVLSYTGGDMFFAAWVILTAKGADRHIIAKWASNEREYDLYFDSALDRFGFQISSNGTGATLFIAANTFGSPPLDTPLLVCAYIRAADTKIYVGVNAGAFDASIAGTLPSNRASAFEVGRNPLSGANYWQGRIFSVGLMKPPADLGTGGAGTLANEIATAWYNNGNPPNFSDFSSSQKTAWGLVSGSGDFWRLDEVAGSGATTRVGAIAINLTDNNTVQTKALSNARNGISADWVVTDTKQDLFIHDGALVSGGGVDGVGWGSPGLGRRFSLPRRHGRALDFIFRGEDGGAQNWWAGFSDSVTGNLPGSPSATGCALAYRSNGGTPNLYVAATQILTFNAGAASGSNRRQVRIVQMSPGAVFLARGHGMPSGYTSLTGPWALLWVDTSHTADPLWPVYSELGNGDTRVALENIEINEIAVPSSVLRDAFNRADSAVSPGSAETGQAYTVGNLADAATLPTWGVSSNKLYLPNAGSQADPHIWLESGLSDCILEADITVPTAASTNAAGIIFRRVDANNYFVARYRNELNTVDVIQCLAGVRTSIGSAALTIADGETRTMRVVLINSSIQVYDGTTRLHNLTNTNMLTGTKHGITANDGGGAFRADNFYAWGGMAA